MARQRDMPMGQHELQAMSRRDVIDALEGMIRAEAQLVAQLQQHLAEHQAMVDAMRS